MSKLALLNARLIDPATGLDTRGGVLIADGIIKVVGASVTKDNVGDARIIDCGGDIVAPGLIDMRVFVGEPGAEHRDTIASASAAAAAGGITTIIATPDTNPPIDDPAVVDFFMRRAAANGRVRILPTAALTKGLEGAEISEIGLLKEAGAIGFSNGNHSLENAKVMRRAMTYARDFDALILHFTEEPELAANGVMNEGEFASRLGLTGIPREAEAIMLDRDLRLVALTDARYHAALISTTLSTEAIAAAKARGHRVTAGTSINHLTLNEGDIGDYRTFLKLSPPLRTDEERRALVAAVAAATIDVIVSDHLGQDVENKRLPFAEADCGAVGMETMLSAGLRLVQSGEISLMRLLAAMSSRPAEILGLPQGRLAVGAPADIIRFDPEEPWVVDPAKLHSRARNTPFDEARMEGRVKTTIVAGEIVLGG